MKVKWKHLFTLILPVLCAGCGFIKLDFLEKQCETYVPQKYKFGYQEAEIWTTSRKMNIGDTVFIRAHIPEAFMDSVSNKPVLVRGRVQLFFRLTTASFLSSSSPFAMDTTIFRVFNTHFDSFVRTGHKVDAYRYDAVLRNGYWDLDIGFIAKKKGPYDIYPAINYAQTNEPLPKGVCMLGDSEKYDALIRIKSRNNRINDIYPILPEGLEESFGFILE